MRGKNWFKPFSLIYYPISWQGFLVTILVAVFCIHIFLDVDRQSHSVSDTLYGIFPFWAGAIGVYLWVGLKTGSEDKNKIE